MKPSLLIGKETHRELAELLQAQGRIVVSGASNETAKSLIVSHLLAFLKQPCCIVTGDREQAQALAHWMDFFQSPCDVLTDEEENSSVMQGELLQRFYLLMEGGMHCTVMSRDLWDRPCPLYTELLERRIVLHEGETLPFTTFVEQLLDRGYVHGNDLYLSPGEYRRVGDTLDIFPIQSGCPYRVRFSFDTIEKLFAVDPANLSSVHEAGPKLQLLPVRYEQTSSLARQIPRDTLLIIDDQDDLEQRIGQRTLRFTAFPETEQQHAHLRYLSILKFYTLTDFLNDLKDKLQQRWTLIIVTRRAEELSAICEEEHIAFVQGEERREGAVTIIGAGEGDVLPHSIQNPDLSCALLTDREIFSLKKAGKQRSIQKLALDFLTSLTAGDYVVHMEHGIGRFEGMTQKVIDDTTREYLELSYAEGDKLFIPVDQADKLSKYVHEEGEEPVLTRLGALEWKRTVEKIKAETEEVAKELLALYAKRAAAKGFAFTEHTDKESAFARSFPYQETPGQRKAIEDIARDMESGRPMDRLVCGDVGFGKTEVAMRAAFKAVQGGKQVAVIAPITILADQHYRNFLERMASFGISLEMLSRFRTPKEQKIILERLRKGDIDIIIGTHRLLQEDVKFWNLGLLIIDEEQRFGVKQKETFKQMRASVDILTLTATPIPRTLNLGLHKLRDITTITTPPPGRLPIITEVRKYSDELVRAAIVHEVQRGGQCFVLHNRVETIDAFADKLRSMVGKARFIVAHGQLKPDDLEERILAFKDGKADVLVSSTIIENGIDLPRANTLIVNEAEHFGLSQLYQLRGRVGRSKTQAFAYLLYHSQKLKDDAKKRLRAIVEACELGSGFQVAMRDLEIRGAGEILGVSQSGTMNTVGVSHYLRMLKNAMQEIKSGSAIHEEEVDAEILLPVEALIPSFYIPDQGEKISVYQKLASSENEELLAEFEEDLRAEYGDPPAQVQALFAILRLKLVCRRAGVTRVKMEESTKDKREIVLTLGARVTAEHIMRLVAPNPQWKISGMTLRIAEESLQGGDNWVMALTSHVALLVGEKEKAEGVKEKEEKKG